MRIVFFIDQLFNGGAERVTALLANEFSKKKEDEIYIIALNEGISYQIEESIHYVVIKQTKLKKPWKIILRSFYTWRTLKSLNPDVIYSLGYMGQYISFIKILRGIKCKFVISERTNPYVEPSNKYMASVRNYLYGKANVIVCQTPQVELYYNKHGHTNTCVIPNPIQSGLPAWEGFASKDIVCACRLAKQKNIPMLLSAFKIVHARYPDYKLKIFGQGSLFEEIENLIEIQGLSKCAYLEGQTDNLPEVLSQSFMSVLSSDYEGISNTMIESLGVGVPTLCTDCPTGGAAMFISHQENGLLSPVGDIEAFAKSMLYYIENKDILFPISKKAKEINEILDLRKIALQWYELSSVY